MNLFVNINTNHNDEHYANQIKLGYLDNFELLYEKYKDKIYSYILTLMNYNQTDAIEITSETFIKIFEFCKQKKVENFSALLYRMAHNLSINRIKKHHDKMIHIEEETREQLPEKEKHSAEVSKNYEKKLLQKLLKSIESKYAEAIYLYYYEEKNYDEIARILQSNKNTVWTLISRGKQKLAELAQKYGYQEAF